MGLWVRRWLALGALLVMLVVLPSEVALADTTPPTSPTASASATPSSTTTTTTESEDEDADLPERPAG